MRGSEPSRLISKWTFEPCAMISQVCLIFLGYHQKGILMFKTTRWSELNYITPEKTEPPTASELNSVIFTTRHSKPRLKGCPVGCLEYYYQRSESACKPWSLPLRTRAPCE
ncbi:uncharacterized protein BDV17DRAFT_184127 [Aspergillus undulatus]|uniref:uncharacterized protein n=1 Tax=Aspergillus undulatus TaxID=1810928 RepID=UPI003CCD01D8